MNRRREKEYAIELAGLLGGPALCSQTSARDRTAAKDILGCELISIIIVIVDIKAVDLAILWNRGSGKGKYKRGAIHNDLTVDYFHLHTSCFGFFFLMNLLNFCFTGHLIILTVLKLSTLHLQSGERRRENILVFLSLIWSRCLHRSI